LVFKRGIFSGGLLVVGSIQEIASAFSSANRPSILSGEAVPLFYGFALLLGIIQIVSSLKYQNSRAKIIILLCCFSVEIAYYVVASFILINMNTYTDIKVLGLFAAIITICIYITSVISLSEKIKR